MSGKDGVPYPRALELFPTLRQSLLASFDSCAMSCRMELDYEQGWSGHPQARGTIAHRTIAKCLGEMAKQGEDRIEPDVALAILRETLRQADVEPRDIVTVPFRQIKDLRWTIITWAANTRWDVTNLVDVEQRLAATVHYENPEGAPVKRTLTGQLDALFIEGEEADHAIVPDWKDTWALPPESEMSEGGYFQQRWYALLVLANYPSVQRVTTREFYVRFSSKPEGKNGQVKTPVREATVYRDALPDIIEEFAALAERFDRAVQEGRLPWDPEAVDLIERGQAEQDPGARAELRREYQHLVGPWSPSPGKHCSYCPAPQKCPIFPSARGVGAITTPEEASTAAAQLLVADAVAKKHRGALKAYAEENGAVPIKAAKDPNRVLGFRPTTRVERPSRDAIERAIHEAGRALTSDELLAMYREKPSSRFEQYTRDPEKEKEREEAEDAELDAALRESIDRAKEARP